MGETERLTHSSEIYVLNATALSVDVFVNYEDQPTISDPKPLVGDDAHGDELTPTMFVVDGTSTRPYGSYTFSVRAKGDAHGEVLAAASIELEQGRSFSGVLHPRPHGGHQLAIYENDLTDGSNARLTIRHTGSPQEVSWELQPNSEDPRIPPDHRSGTLRNGEWQMAREVIDNDYLFEFFLDDERVAWFPDLDLAAEKNIIVYLLGDPRPTTDEGLLQRPIAFQELEFDPGPSGTAEITPPAPPLSTADHNAPIEFTCPGVEMWETTRAVTEVTAVDPDGMVTNLSVDRVEPQAGGIDIPDHAVTPSPAIGEPATAEVTFDPDIAPGAYRVWIGANRGSLAQQDGCSVELTVTPITVSRLQDQVDRLQGSDDIEEGLAADLHTLLIEAQQHLDTGDTREACAELEDLLGRIGAEKGKGITDTAHDRLDQETKALRSNLGCG